MNVSGGEGSFELDAPLLNLSGVGMSSVTTTATVVLLRDSIFVNIKTITWRQMIQSVINTSTLVNRLTMIDGCGNVWCSQSESKEGVISGGTLTVECTRHLSSLALLNFSTPLPSWLSIERCATKTASLTSSANATRSWQETISVTSVATSSQKVSLSKTTQRSVTSLTSPSLTILLPIIQPTTPSEPPVIVQAAAVAIVAPLAGALLATSVAGVIQRSTIALRFSDCTASELQPSGAVVNELPPPRGEHMAVSENPTRLAFGPAEGAMYRGAAVGNLLLFVGLALVIVPAVYVLNRCKKKSSQVPFSTTMAQLQLPGRAYVVYSVLLQPTTTAVFGVLLLSVSCADIALAVVVLATLLLLAVWPVWRVHEGCKHLVRCEMQPLGSGVVEYFVGRCVTWVPKSTSAPPDDLKPFDEIFVIADNFAKQYSSFIGRVRSGLFCEVFFAFGFLWSMITGVVGALDPADSRSCQAAQVTLVVVAALSLTSLVAVRPYASPADRNVNITLEVLSLVIAALSLANTGNSDAAEAISYVQLVISAVVSALRAVVSARTWLAKSRDGKRKVVDSDGSPSDQRQQQRVAIVSSTDGERLHHVSAPHNISPRLSPKERSDHQSTKIFARSASSDRVSTIRVPLRRASLLSSLPMNPTMRSMRLKSLIDGESASHNNNEHHIDKAVVVEQIINAQIEADVADMTKEVHRYFAEYCSNDVTTLPRSMQDDHLERLLLPLLASKRANLNK